MKKLPAILSAAFFLFAGPVNAAPMSLSLHDSDLRSAIMTVARAGGLKVSIDGSIGGKISLTATDTEPEKILEIISKTADLKMVEESGIYIFTARNVNNSLLQTYILPIRYGDAEILRKAVVMSLDEDDKEKSRNSETETVTKFKIRPDGSMDMTSHGMNNSDETGRKSNRENDSREKRVLVNPEVNALVLVGTPAEYERAKKLLQNLDAELKQVSVEAKILAIDKNASKNLGIEWMWSTIPQYPDRNDDSYTTMNTDGSMTRYENYSYERTANDLTGYGIIRFGKGPEGIPFEWYYGARINALVANGKARILSRPNVTTIQGREAEINISDNVPVPKIQTTNSTTTTSIEYRRAGIILRYTPRINEDGTITATIHTEVSTPTYVEDLKMYRFNERSADTTVTVRDGQPMIIGGLIGAEESKSISKIPFLGDLPILGWLFRNHRRSKSESELIIFLTAHVLNGAGDGIRYTREENFSAEENSDDE